MDATAVVGCFRDRTILVTGSTGFLGKLLVEKILRVQPNVKKLYLVVRASDAASAEQRILSQVLGKDLFNTMREKHGLAGFEELIQEKIVPLAGDIGIQNFGLDRSTVDDLCEEIDVIIHGAATTSFYERYDVALASNALGAKYICEFAKKCSNMKLLLHLSTAFVAGTREGLLLEEALQMGETLRPGYCLDIKAELRLVEKIKTELRVANSGGPDQSLEKTAMKELGLKRACHFGWPNVYTFTKAMGEMLLAQERGDLPLIIMRPAMVTSTFQDPFPGWIEGARTIDALIVAYTEQAFPCFVGDRKNIMDAVPADMVVNATLVAMAVHWNEKGYVIYHVCSALQNPLSGYVLEDACWDYFSKHPRIREDGKPLKNKRPYVFKRFTLFRAYLIMVYKLPLEILHAVSLLFCGLFSQSYNKYNRRYNFLILLVKLYAPYAFFKGCFDDTNITRLLTEVKMDCNGGSIFNFDPRSMDWHSYLLNVHVPAVIKYGRKN
ncbi:hypothetical protein CFC21_106965 [Triticum aestivum]|uniref:Fatty acyl-CoA reductase n=2 Tax=Triticum aestivum TaxID=4565 RepID=A0A3B6TCS9_WHEAT|nr:alcohol-forming fatty acyl-CoA reductase-like [Triticum aestivum]KAF7106214.1 hypothetical protein CFC21_106965 [Triticum aestivum]